MMNKYNRFLKKTSIFLLIFLSYNSYSQMICITEDDTDWREARAKIINSVKDGPSDFSGLAGRLQCRRFGVTISQ